MDIINILSSFLKDYGTTIAAIVGAGAWIPIVCSKFKKARITIISSPQCSVGFIVNIGPVFRISLGIAAQNKSVVITSIKLILTNTEDSQTKKFTWAIINKKISSSTIQGTILEVKNERFNEVLALNISPYFIEENFIVFHEDSSLKEIEEKIISADRELRRLESQDKKSSFLQTKELLDLQRTTEQSFFWKAGIYKLRFILETSSNEKFKIINDEYNFSLTKEDIEYLERNKLLLRSCYENLSKKDNEEKNKVEYIWRYTKIKKI